MGPTPSADLVGSIIGVDDADDYKRPNLRKVASDRTPVKSKDTVVSPSETANKEPPMQIVWRNVLIFIYLHAAALYGFYLCFTAAKWATLGWCKKIFSLACYLKHFLVIITNISFFLVAFFLFLFGGFGITGGAHRLWAHRCYKAKWPLRLFAALAQTIAVQVTQTN